jgi:hypothetical protein
MNYEISIELNDFMKIVSNKSPDPIRPRSYQIMGNWMEPFEEKIGLYERISSFKLKQTKARLNNIIENKDKHDYFDFKFFSEPLKVGIIQEEDSDEIDDNYKENFKLKDLNNNNENNKIRKNKIRCDAAFFRASATCFSAANCECKYYISAKNWPLKDASFIIFNVDRKGEHNHSESKKIQLRGKIAEEIYTEMAIESNFSSINYYEKKIGEGCDPETFPKPDALRKMVSKVLYEDFTSVGWLANLQEARDNIHEAIQCQKLPGYIQTIQVDINNDFVELKKK